MQTKKEIVENWLPRYTGRPLETFGEYILLTNFGQYVELFAQKFWGRYYRARQTYANGNRRKYYDN